ncbi:MAG: sialidase family protein [Acidobacteriota bacterium]
MVIMGHNLWLGLLAVGLLHASGRAEEKHLSLRPDSSWVLLGSRTDWTASALDTISAPKGLDRTEESLAFLPANQVSNGRIHIKFRMTDWPHYIQAKLIFRSEDSRQFYMVVAFSMATDMSFTKEEGLMGLALLRGNASGHRQLLQYIPHLPWKPGYWYELRVDLDDALIRVSLYSELEKRFKPLMRVRDGAYSSGSIGIGASGPVEFKDLFVVSSAAKHSRGNWQNITRRPYRLAWNDVSVRGSMPKLARRKDGALLMAVSELFYRAGPPPQVFVFESKNNGNTWKRISSVPVGYAGLPLSRGETVYLFDSYVKGDGDSILRISQEDIAAHKPYEFVPHARISSDGGKTWGKPEPLKITETLIFPTKRQSLNMFVPPRILADGRWLLPIFTVAREPFPMTVESLLLRSSDGGDTWQLGPIDPNHEDASEMDVVQLEPSHLLAVMRTNFNTGFHGEAHSHDMGRTWSPVKLGSIPGWSSGPRLLKTKNGILLCMHRLIGTMISHSADLGKTWTTYQIDHPIEVMGDLLELGDGRVLAVYSGGGWGGIPRLQHLTVTEDGIRPAP